MHNAAFAEKGINAVYLAFLINDIGKGIDSVRELGMGGVSVTIPFKQSVIPFLDEIDDLALEIGAVNTIINNDGRLIGFNTDSMGAVEPLKKKCCIKNNKVCIIGAGGAARAVAFGIKKEKGMVFIVNRSEQRGKVLAEQVGGEFVPLESIKELFPDIIINTTPVGMVPNIDNTPVPSEILQTSMTIMDIVYNPLKTKLIKDAENAGCAIVDGLSMFVHQGAEQFELFTGIKAPESLMKQVLMERING